MGDPLIHSLEAALGSASAPKPGLLSLVDCGVRTPKQDKRYPGQGKSTSVRYRTECDSIFEDPEY